MNIIVTSIGNFQEYILVNIRQLITLGHDNIYVICNADFFPFFHTYKDKIKLVAVEELSDSYHFNERTTLNYQFRYGFYKLTSSRLFWLYECMKKYDITDVIHLENDTPIYYNCNVLLPMLDTTKIYMPFDSYRRNILSILYIPNHIIFKHALDHYNIHSNDMENFANIKHATGLIEHFPICITDHSRSDEYQFVTQNFERFQYIFDAAAIGQYLGGVDPRNIPGDTTGFINETCVVKYNEFAFEWKIIDGMKKPFILINNQEYPIFNLHIHCKSLEKFV